MFSAALLDRYGKSRAISDDASDIHLELDTDDVNPYDVTDANVQRIVNALNREFYPSAVRHHQDRHGLDSTHDD